MFNFIQLWHIPVKTAVANCIMHVGGGGGGGGGHGSCDILAKNGSIPLLYFEGI